jgi:hypothetical protein
MSNFTKILFIYFLTYFKTVAAFDLIEAVNKATDIDTQYQSALLSKQITDEKKLQG